ncbi:nuclear transport factor 2 family protein [Fulvivirgaceae bacterium BMA10]|uniref:Nuclear transport factor 2 family protein n=1 Tax=Splendidivirga corallicola TaxID=3051826 RepID=A0ABT8KMU2_9BACT|nr:nuclear transport factor 2 family protein [Fulvivirgaceae bacterium BMA10]
MAKEIRENLDDLFEILSKGQFLEGMEKYLHDDVVLREGNAEPKVGKAHCMALEKEVLEGVGEFIRYEVSSSAVANDTSFYEAIMEYKEKNGNHVKVEQAVVSQWKDGKIIHERFYHS